MVFHFLTDGFNIKENFFKNVAKKCTGKSCLETLPFLQFDAPLAKGFGLVPQPRGKRGPQTGRNPQVSWQHWENLSPTISPLNRFFSCPPEITVPGVFIPSTCPGFVKVHRVAALASGARASGTQRIQEDVSAPAQPSPVPPKFGGREVAKKPPFG